MVGCSPWSCERHNLVTKQRSAVRGIRQKFLLSWSLWSDNQRLKVNVKVAQSCPTLCNTMDYILEWVAFPFSRGSSQPRDRTQVSRIAGRFLTSWATREAQSEIRGDKKIPAFIKGVHIPGIGGIAVGLDDHMIKTCYFFPKISNGMVDLVISSEHADVLGWDEASGLTSLCNCIKLPLDYACH